MEANSVQCCMQVLISYLPRRGPLQFLNNKINTTTTNKHAILSKYKHA